MDADMGDTDAGEGDAHMEVMDAAMGAAQQYPDPGKERNIPGMDPNAPPAPQVDWVKHNNGVGLFITSAESPWFFFSLTIP
jgi:hypothetical protein